MSSSHTPGMLSNRHWPAVIDQLLDGADGEHRQAREQLWIQVKHFVVDVVRLRIGPLGDDPDVRQDIAVDVIVRLQNKDWEQVRRWRDRQRRRQDSAAWWTFVTTVTHSAAIDLARGSKLRLGKRGEPFRWARVVPVDPIEFIEAASEADVATYLAMIQRMRRGAAAEPESEPSPEPPRPTRKRGENGKNGEG